MGQGLGADALYRGDVGSAAGSEQDRARGNHSMKELLLRWTPGRHDHIAGSGVTKSTVVLCPFEPDHISDERHQCATGISVGGIYQFTWRIGLISQPKEDPYHSQREEETGPPFLCLSDTEDSEVLNKVLMYTSYVFSSYCFLVFCLFDFHLFAFLYFCLFAFLSYCLFDFSHF